MTLEFWLAHCAKFIYLKYFLFNGLWGGLACGVNWKDHAINTCKISVFDRDDNNCVTHACQGMSEICLIITYFWISTSWWPIWSGFEMDLLILSINIFYALMNQGKLSQIKKLGYSMILCSCSSKLFTIPPSHCGGWDCGWNHEPFIYFWIFTTSKERKTKVVKGTKGFFLGKKWDPSLHVMRKKNLKSCLTFNIKTVSTCAHMDVGGQDDGTYEATCN